MRDNSDTTYAIENVKNFQDGYKLTKALLEVNKVVAGGGGGGKAASFYGPGTCSLRKINVRDLSNVKLLFTNTLCTLLNTLPTSTHLQSSGF